MTRIRTLVWMSIVLWPFSTAWPDHLKTLTRTVERTGEDVVSVQLHFGAGQIEIRKGDRDALLEARVEYDPERYDPSIECSRKSDKEGILVLRTHSDENMRDKISGVQRLWSENTWTLRFSPGVVLRFEIEVGAGSAEIDLTGLQVRDLDIEAGASTLTVLFEEPNRENLERFSVETGASKVRLKGLGYANFTRLDFRGGMGQFALDFSGKPEHPTEAHISTGLGALTILIPEALGAQLQTSDMFLASLSLDRGFQSIGGCLYQNKAYRESKAPLTLEIEGGLGSINVESIR